MHLIVDNYATHKHPNVQKWLAEHPRLHMHFTPTSASWLYMVECFFRDITDKRLRCGVITSVPELITAIDEYIAHHNTKPEPFIWTKSARDILQKVIRANSLLSTKQNAAARDSRVIPMSRSTPAGHSRLCCSGASCSRVQAGISSLTSTWNMSRSSSP